jgi:hypothetical protein
MTSTWRERALLGGPFAAVLLLVLLQPGTTPTLCPFALITGTACPGCGMTRAVSHLFRGEIAEAILMHPLAPLIVAEVTVTWGWFVLRRLGLVRPLPSRVAPLILVVTGMALVVVWVIRLVSGTLPPV